MEELIKLLKGIRPDVDFENETELIDEIVCPAFLNASKEKGATSKVNPLSVTVIALSAHTIFVSCANAVPQNTIRKLSNDKRKILFIIKVLN